MRIMPLAAALLAALLIAGGASCGEAEKKGNPALVKAAETMAQKACACVDEGGKDCMGIKVDGKKGMALFMNSDTKDLTKAEAGKFGDARSRWNECFKPGYKPAGKAPGKEEAEAKKKAEKKKAEEKKVAEAAKKEEAKKEEPKKEEPKKEEPKKEEPPPAPAVKITKVAVGDELTCALRSDGKLLCWGLNEDHELGLPDKATDAVVPQLVKSQENVEDFWLDESNSVTRLGGMYGAGAYNTICTRTKDSGAVRCHGHDEGWLLHGGKKPDDTVAPVEVQGLAKAVDVDFGGGTSCGVMADGSAVCWGSNAFKALGREAKDEKKVGSNYGLGKVTGLADAVALGVGQNRACARTKSGEVWCWGDKKLAAKVEPDKLATPVSHISMSTNHDKACVVDSASKVVCGERGNWKVVEGVAEAVEVAVGMQTICSRDKAGAVMCWCKSSQWSFMKCAKDNTPAPLALPEPATQIAVGARHGCALLQSGGVACWGENRRGQLGDGTLTDRQAPVLVKGLDATETTPPALPAGAELPPVAWPGDGLDACAATAVTGDATFTPRTVYVEPSRTIEGHWALKLVMSEDVFEGKLAPRPRGSGVALKLDVVARKEVQRSANGRRVAYTTLPLAKGVYKKDAGLSLDGLVMNRLNDQTLTDAKLELTHVDVDGGVVCGTIDAGMAKLDQHIRGRFAAKIDPAAIQKAAMVTESTPPALKDLTLPGGGELAAKPCDTGDVAMVSHAGSSPMESLTAVGKRMVIGVDQDRLLVLDIAAADARTCKVAPAADWGAAGYLLPDDSPSPLFVEAGGKLFMGGSFGRVHSLSTTGATEKRCEIKGARKLAASPNGKQLLAADSSPPLKLYDATSCEEQGAWSNDALKSCNKAAFYDAKSAVAVCGKRLHLATKSKVAFSVGSDDYKSPERLPTSADDLGPCGKAVCVADGDELQVWKKGGDFAGKVDLKELTGATKVMATAGDAKGLWVLAAYQRGESGSWETRLLRVSGFPKK